MATRSAIIEKLPDGTYRGIYCHYDGYLSYNGKVLREHYADPAKVSALIELGEISVLRERVEPVGPHSFCDREEGVTVAYHRDRGEDYLVIRDRTAEAVADRIGHDGHVYVFEDGRWSHNGKIIEDSDFSD